MSPVDLHLFLQKGHSNQTVALGTTNHCRLKSHKTIPAISRTSPKTTRYMSLKENHEEKDNSSVQRLERKVEKGSALEENSGYTFQTTTKRATAPSMQSVKLRAYTDFCFRRTLLIGISHFMSLMLGLYRCNSLSDSCLRFATPFQNLTFKGVNLYAEPSLRFWSQIL